MVELDLQTWGTIGTLAATIIGAGFFIGKLYQKVSNQEQTIKEMKDDIQAKPSTDKVQYQADAIQELKRDVQGKPSMESFDRVEERLSVLIAYVRTAVGPEKASEILEKLFERRGRKT